MNHINRKNYHVALAEKFYQNQQISDFDNIHYVHHSFPMMRVSEVNLSTNFATFKHRLPFFINAMTGGSEWTKKINEKLAIVARETGLAMASGSLTQVLRNPLVEDSFTIIREVNPNGIVFANIGAGQSVIDAKKVIKTLKADALQVHLNAPQELIMLNGDRDFTNWLFNIEEMVKTIDIPIIVKEVGFGMSQRTIEQLLDVGVKYIDLSGKGGTNFAKIENHQRKVINYDYLDNWGQSTVISLLEATPLLDKAEFVASGGIRNPLDLVKALSLGASMVGISGYLLWLVLNEGVEKTIMEVNNWQEQIITIMTLLGKKSIKELSQTDLIISGYVLDWCNARGISSSNFGYRKNNIL